MSTISAILEPDADGTLHFPLPQELRNSTLKVTATLQAVSPLGQRPSEEDALTALRKLRELGTFKDVLDPVNGSARVGRIFLCLTGIDILIPLRGKPETTLLTANPHEIFAEELRRNLANR